MSLGIGWGHSLGQSLKKKKKKEDSNVLHRFVVRKILGCFLWCQPIRQFSDTKWMGFQQFNSGTLHLELTLDPPS